MVFLLLFIFMKNSSTRHKFLTLIMINYAPNNTLLKARAPFFPADAIQFFYSLIQKNGDTFATEYSSKCVTVFLNQTFEKKSVR